jgi:hypothetical protein
LMIKHRQIFIVLIIYHKNTINIINLVGLLWWRTNVIIPPPHRQVAHERFLRRFRIICFYCDPKCVLEGFFLSSAMNVFNFAIGTILQSLGFCNLNTYEDVWVAFIGQKITRNCNIATYLT